MRNDTFYRLGNFIYTFRWLILLFYLILTACCIPLLPKVMSQFTSTGFIDPASESAMTDQLLNKKIGYRDNQFIILYESPNLVFKDSLFSQEIKASLSNLKKLPLSIEIIYPDNHNHQVSHNKHLAFAVVMLKEDGELSENVLRLIKKTIKKPEHLSMLIGGKPIFLEETKKQTQQDLIKAELIASPIAIVTLLVVFGTVVSAFIPMILDGICAIFILSLLFLFGQFFLLSIFTLNIALLLGLCLSLDYALFIMNRFRDELNDGYSIKEALSITVATAGKAVFFSGLAVFISLSALLMFPINILFSVGTGGIIAVAMAVIVSIGLLPAILAIMNTKINFLSIPLLFNKQHHKNFYWQSIITIVIKFPWISFISILAVLLILGYPFLSVQLGLSDYKILPKNLESRQVFDHIKIDFNENLLSPIDITVESKTPILSYQNIAALYRYTEKLKNNPDIDRVQSITTIDPKITKLQYQKMYTHFKNDLNPSLKQFLKLTTNNNLTIITLFSKNPDDFQKNKQLIQSIRNQKNISHLLCKVSGASANMLDVFHTISLVFHYALTWIIILTYVILLVLLRSLLLPIKAILMTILSLFASYGVLVFIIQEGHFSHLLHFQPQGMIDISLLIIIFCALFGFSMDYEVFLLSRIKEEYEKTRNTVKSIQHGIVHSSRIITSAAIIVIFICFSFISANVLLVKAFGLGISVAIFVDAFLIRTILVPATMVLLGKWNWYLPKWIEKILPDVFFNLEGKKY